MPLGVRSSSSSFSRPARTQPSGRNARGRARENVAVADVVVEQAAVVDDARDQAHVVLRGGLEHELSGPRLERVEDDHRPVDPLGEALEAVDQVEREAVGRAGRDAERARETGLADRLHAVPDDRAGVADAVGVVQQQQVEVLDAAAFEAALGRHPDVSRILVGPRSRGSVKRGKPLAPSRSPS